MRYYNNFSFLKLKRKISFEAELKIFPQKTVAQSPYNIFHKQVNVMIEREEIVDASSKLCRNAGKNKKEQEKRNEKEKFREAQQQQINKPR